MAKYCIFHMPDYINLSAKSGSSVRPLKMIEAFQEIGYTVECVHGYAENRKKHIKKIKNDILSGKKYDFMYSETSNTPTILTEKNHLPSHPFLDYGLFRLCKQNNIPIGLFYRDIYWKFPLYKKALTWYKRAVTIPMYYLDLYYYKKYMKKVYLPSGQMGNYIPVLKEFEELPPGGNYDSEIIEQRKAFYKNRNFKDGDKLKLFYVGGIGPLYDLSVLLDVAGKSQFLELVLCCREEEWAKYKQHYEKYMSGNIKVVHESGAALRKYYMWADLCCLYYEEDEYRDFAVPIKLFEYMSFITPVIATYKSAAGNIVDENGVGWSIEYKKEKLKQLLYDLSGDYKEVIKKSEISEQALCRNCWKNRAAKVAEQLLRREGD